MATALALPPQTEVAYFTRGSVPLGNLEEREDGTAQLKGLKVFRTGRLTDSRGNTREWTHAELDEAVSNFGLLSDELPDVPMRVGHTRSPDQIIGYFSAIRREGDFLVADFDITEPDAVKKIKRRTYRSRSMEIGAFRSDDHGTCWPVAMGLAFVDIPAVTRLYENELTGTQFSVLTETPEGDPMSGQNQPDLFAAYYAQGLADAVPPALEFQCFGASVTDPAAVQAHIAQLEAFHRETVEGGRKSFVDQLVKDKKIIATQQAHFEKIALELSDSSFEVFKDGWKDAPTNSLLNQYSAGGDGDAPPRSGGPEDNNAQYRRDLEERIAMHRRAGQMTEDQIKQLESYKELERLNGQAK